MVYQYFKREKKESWKKKDSWAPFFMGVHFVVQSNLAIQSLFGIKIESS
jgi:hypothetical protein